MQTVQTKETMGIRAFISYLSDTLAEKNEIRVIKAI